MPRITNSLPKYRLHKASGNAVVTIQGRDVYLGPHGTKASKVEYDRLVGEWLTAGRPAAPDRQYELTVVELAARYRSFAHRYYRKNGKVTSTVEGVELTLRLLCRRYGRTPAADFGPLALQAMQSHFVELNYCRTYVNDSIDRIKRMFRWAVANELVPPSTAHGLNAVPGLRKGRTEARESPPVLPVEQETVDATLPHLPAVVADMVRLQRLTGCRPAEVCSIRPMDVDASGDVWFYRPESHKTEHHGRGRTICIGPRAQDILRPYLLRPADAYCFSPQDSEKKRRAARHENRRTPLSCGNRPGTNRRRKPKRTAGEQYTTESYRRAIHRACDLAFPAPEPLCRREDESIREWQKRLTDKQRAELDRWQSDHRWSPNRLRHSAATEIRRKYGLEAAQVTLGHATADVTQIYAERDVQLASKVMREVG